MSIDTKRNMSEKLFWMQRSYERMKSGSADLVEVQDHFLSFLHASRLIWFYFGFYVEASGRGKIAGKLVDGWKNELSIEDKKCWDVISQLRTHDIHVQPVQIKNINQPALLAFEEHLLTINGHLLSVGDWQYEVDYDDKKYDVFLLCNKGLDLLAKFINEFDAL
ncbi:MAG: hypothetical protein OT477_05560 [Chloroflexi bacterium]|nr:hypothetical protein [Chloroflexota bacterium]